MSSSQGNTGIHIQHFIKDFCQEILTARHCLAWGAGTQVVAITTPRQQTDQSPWDSVAPALHGPAPLPTLRIPRGPSSAHGLKWQRNRPKFCPLAIPLNTPRTKRLACSWAGLLPHVPSVYILQSATIWKFISLRNVIFAVNSSPLSCCFASLS